MIHRLALIAGSVAAAAILAIGFLATGFGPRAATVDAEQPLAAVAADPLVTGDTDAQATAKPVTRVKTTTVYVRPAPKARVIHITRHASAPTKRHPTKAVKVPAAHRGEADDNGGEHEREDD